MSGADRWSALQVSVSRWFERDVEARLATAVGGMARLRAVTVLACVLALNSADIATVGVVGDDLERSLGISDTQLGLLISVSTGIGAVATLPIGWLVDRVNRVRLLWLSIVLWAAAMIFSAAASDYGWLLLSRVVLGVVVATATPVVSSLTGDLFPPSERGRIYGFILSGELIGVALGYVASGALSALGGWRAGFALLGALSLVLAIGVRMLLPEPARGGQSWIPSGATTILSAKQARARPSEPPTENVVGDRDTDVADAVRQANVEPIPDLVLHHDPAKGSLRWAVRYVLRVRTNVLLIIASGLGYFYLSGLEAFAPSYLHQRYGLGTGVATLLLVVIGLGAILGVLTSGRTADALIRRGHVPARVVVAGVAFLIAVAGFLPAMVLPAGLLVGMPLFVLGTIGLGGSNAPLDAARLDIMHSRLWGRAESVRTVLRNVLTAIGPLLFGFASTQIGENGLVYTFPIMLIPLLAAGLLLLVRARHAYPRDVATAVASEYETQPR